MSYALASQPPKIQTQRGAKAGASRRSLARRRTLYTSELRLARQPPQMHYVYLLQSRRHPAQQYIGLTCDLRRRLQQHNNATSPHTKKFCPWDLIAYFAFRTETTAATFEKYLKTGSGRAFVRRHFRAERADGTQHCERQDYETVSERGASQG